MSHFAPRVHWQPNRSNHAGIRSINGLLTITVLLLMLLALLPTRSVEAQSNPLRIRKTVVGNLSTVQTGQIFQYRITASCNNLTVTCGDLTLTDTLPTGVTFLGVSGPVESLPATSPTVAYIYDTAGLPSSLVIRNKRSTETGARSFQDGEIVEFILTVQANLNATPGTLSNNLTGDVTQRDGGGDPPPVVLPPVAVTLLPPTPPDPNGSGWTYTKTQVVPVAPQNPTTGQPTVYQLSVCPIPPLIGRLPYTGMTITDTYPTGATLLDSGGGTFAAPNQVNWSIPNNEVADALANSTCVNRQIIVRYDSPTFSVPTNGLTNTMIVDAAECTTTCGSSNLPFDLVAPQTTVSTTKSIAGSPVGQGGVGRFFLDVSPNQGNVPAPNLELFDNIDESQIRVTELQSGRWSVLDPLLPFVSVRASVRVTDDLGAITTFGPYNGGTNVVVPTLPAPPRRVSEVRWIFEYDPDGPGPQSFQPGLPLGFRMVEPPEIVFTPLTNPPFDSAYTPGTYQNCADATFTGGTGTAQNCVNYELGNPGVTGTNVQVTKTNLDGSTFAPAQEMQFELRMRLSERARAGDTVVNPSFTDVLPPELEFVSWDSVSFVNVPSGPHPLPFFRRDGSTLRWYWAASPQTGSLQRAPAGLPFTVPASGSTAFTMTANGTDQDVIVRFTARVSPNVAPNPAPLPAYTNALVVYGPATAVCENGILGSEGSPGFPDDGDGIGPESGCRTTSDFRVRRALALEGAKWIRNPNYTPNAPRFPEFALHTDDTVSYDSTNSSTGQSCSDPQNNIEYPLGSGNRWVRFPCVAFGFPENPLTTLPPSGPFTPAAPNDDQFEYLLDVTNAGNVVGRDYVLYDLLPRNGDTGSGGPLSETPRQSRFETFLTGPIVTDSLTGVTGGGVLVEYSQSINPCRPEVFDGDPPPIAGCTNDWTSSFPADPRTVRAFRIRFEPATRIAVGGRMQFRAPMAIAFDAQYGPAQIAWNSFAHTAVNDENPGDGFLPPAEPRKVGIRVPERFSIGNRVWRDSDNSGTINAPDSATPGIPGVTVNLYRDTDNNGVPDGAAIATTTTDTNGFYLFGNLFPDANPDNNRYIVGIPASNFNASGPLENTRSSTGTPASGTFTTPVDDNDDRNDHGIDPASVGNEVFSPPIQLTLYSEQLNETDSSGNPRDGAFSRGLRGESNNNSDLSVDFGFFTTNTEFSIGNRLWYDDGDNGAGGFTLANRNNGIQDSGERPVAGARVDLYRDGNLDGVLDTAELIRFDITDANGHYLFDRLNEADPVAGRPNSGLYYVVIAAGNFNPTANFDPDGGGPLPAATPVLRGWHSSFVTGTQSGGVAGNPSVPPVDRDDNGNEPTSLRPDLDGVRSGPITLLLSTPTVTGETDLSSDTGTNPGFNPTEDDGPLSRGRFGETDERSDLAIDFGFTPPLSLGNRVWFDSGATASGINLAQFNDGIMNGTEAPAPNVTVQLFRDLNNNGLIDAGENAPYLTTTTNAQGYYLFDGLIPTNYDTTNPFSYLVRIAPAEFNAGGDLVNYVSSNGNNTDLTLDMNDNGIDNAAPGTNGILTPAISLTYAAQPLQTGTETDIPATGFGPNGRGLSNPYDNDSNLTFDFGFVQPRSLGNRVWIDNGTGTGGVANDGIQNGTEAGVAGVAVSLYFDNDNNGTPDGSAIRTDVTNANGYYLFDNLPAGRYIVGVDASNFGSGQPLFELGSSVPTVNNASNNLDRRDNGINTATPNTGNGVISASINMLTVPASTIPTGESDLSADAGSGFTFNPTSGDGPNSRGRFGENDNASDLTIDFGFFKPLSIGNRVWLDDGTGSGVRNDGVQNGTEAGISGVTVQLFAADGSGNRTGPVLATDTTDANGYYLFNGLTPGNYVVYLPASNFTGAGALVNYDSSTGSTGDTGVDRNDNGVDDNFPGTNGITSNAITLALDSEATGETDLSGAAGDGPNSRGTNNESDDNSDLTVDFGFVVPTYSLGNRVWFDVNNNAVRDAGEALAPNVTMRLYRDNGDGNFTGADTLVAETATDANGYYLFETQNQQLGNPLLTAGNYFVVVAPTEFGPGGDLQGYYSSNPVPSTRPDAGGADNGTENDDNGLYVTPEAARPAAPDPATGGVRSRLITLTKNQEPVLSTATTVPGVPASETDVPATGYGPEGRGTQGQLDSNSDLTIDFGFYQPMSLGNRIWLDNGVTSSGFNLAQYNDGVQNGTEPGVSGVLVHLYLADGSGNPTGAVLASDTTDANGYYLFDNLTPGDYVVVIAASNFSGVLTDLASSTPTSGDNGTDRDDNGQNTPIAAGPGIGGIRSDRITLTLNGEAAGESDLSGNAADGVNNRGTNGEFDGNSDLTIDFGFVPRFSLGNRVWSDTDNSGDINGSEAGIDGVTVELYAADGSGNPTGAALGTATTADGGYYRFDNLIPGDYVVVIPASNFTGTGALFGTRTSTGAAQEADPNSNGDSNDNGLDTPVSGAIRSGVMTLGPGNDEPTSETDLSPSGQGTVDSRANMTMDFGFVPTYSLGNRVWLDTDNSGTINGTEAGIAGVNVRLLTSGGAEVDSDPTTPVVEPTIATTDANGYYRFDGLLPGDYLVQIDSSNFNTGQPLAGWNSSTPDEADPNNDVDSNDNGVGETPGANGIRSGTVTLGGATEPTAESDLSPTGQGAPDNRANMTVDFGFAPYSLGNRVWFDADNSGTINGAEVGINGVTVRLLDSAGNDVDSDPATAGMQPTLTTTADGGYYRFDNLRAGGYLVQIEASNFSGAGVLVGHASSTPDEASPNSDGDSNDNGVGSSPDVTNGIRSGVVTLGPSEPTSEADRSPSDSTEPNNRSNLTVDFGFFTPVSLGNYVWLDANADGVQDAGESPIEGATVALFRADGTTPATDINGNAVVSVTTNTDGLYNFTNLAPGDYVVRVTPPAGYLPTTSGGDPDDNDTTDSNGEVVSGNVQSQPITLVAQGEPINDGDSSNNSNLTVDFGFFQPVSLGNFIWLDINGDGLQEASEPGIENATVELFEGDGVTPAVDVDGNAVASVTTGTDGLYSFTNLRPGDYVVRVTPPTGLTYTRVLNGDPDDNTNTDSNGEPVAGESYVQSQPITLTSRGEPDGDPIVDGDNDPNSNLTVDFGFTRYSLGNRVWLDTDNSGDINGAEAGIDGVTVRLLDSAGNDIDSNPDMMGMQPTVTTTADGGYYRFLNLLPGDYVVQLDASNFAAGGALAGLNSSSGASQEANPNDNRDSNDNGLDVPVGGAIRSGIITIEVLPSEPTTETDRATADPVEPNASSNMTVDFGFAPYSLGNRVWRDDDDSGDINGTETGIDGVTVELFAADSSGNPTGPALATATTADGGYYRFDNLRAGDYVVVIPASNFATGGALAGTRSSTPDEAAANDDVDSNDNGLGSSPNNTSDIRSSVVTLGPNGGEPTAEGDLAPTDQGASDNRANMTLDFGFVPTYSLGNRVWLDTNNNSLLDGSERGIANVTVELYRDVDNSGTFNTGDTLAGTTTTNADGYYQFTGLNEGDYLVVIPDSNFTGTGALLNLLSSGTSFDSNGNQTETSAPAPNDDAENDDNGFASGTPGSGGYVASGAITLGGGDTEPTGESDRTDGLTDVTPDNRSNTTLDFGFLSLVQVGNLVWEDANNNGRVDSGENPLAGATVHLLQPDGSPARDASGNLVAEIVTLNDGLYRFINLNPGDYIIQVVPPAGYRSSTGAPGSLLAPGGPFEPAPGSNSDTDNDDNGSSDATGARSTPVSLSLGGEPTTDGDGNSGNLTVDFGFFRPASLGSVVWFDRNGNGVRDPGEPGAPGVIVTLYDGNGQPVLGANGQPLTTITDINGEYRFINLVPGSYQVGFTNLPGGFTFTAPNRGNGSNDSDADPSTGRSSIITLVPGEDNPNLWAGLINPTAVTLVGFSATWETNQVVVRWETAAEVGTAGFTLVRSSTGSRADAVEVTTSMIPATGRGQGGAQYEWTDTTAQPGATYTYWLVETETSGLTNEYGPARTASPEPSNTVRVFLPVVTR